MRISNRAMEGPASGIRVMFELASKYENVINLGIGEPDFQTPKNIVESCKDALDEGHTKYTSNAGDLELRVELAKKLERDNKLPTDPTKNLIVTTGAGEAITLALFTLIDPGDEVLVGDPFWPNYAGQISLANGKLVPVPTYEEDGFCITPENIEKMLTPKSKALILNSPGNPTGSMLNEEQLREIADLALKHNLYIISDETYEKIIYDVPDYKSIGSMPDISDMVITIQSFSKTYSMTGWRVGYAHGHEEIIKYMVKLQENISSCVSSFSQKAAIEGLKGDQHSVEQMVSEYKRRRDLVVARLNNMNGVHCFNPKGAFYVFPNIKSFGKTSEEIAIDILNTTQVITTPGSAFGEQGEGFLRLTFAQSIENLEEALDRLESYFKANL